MTIVHRPKFLANKRRHIRISQSVNFLQLVSSAKRFLSNQSSASTRSNASRQIHPGRRSDQLLSSTNTDKSQVTARICSFFCSVIVLSRALQVIAKVRSVSVHSVIRCTLLASLLSCHGPFFVRSAQLFHRSNGFLQLLHPSPCSQPILTLVCSAPQTSARFNGCAILGTFCGGVWKPCSVEYQSCKFAMLL